MQGDCFWFLGQGRAPGERDRFTHSNVLRLPWWLQTVKNPPAKYGETWVQPGLGGPPGEGNGYPLQYSGLWRIPRGIRVGHNWATFIFPFLFCRHGLPCLRLSFSCIDPLLTQRRKNIPEPFPFSTVSNFIILPSCLLFWQVRKNSLDCTSAVRAPAVPCHPLSVQRWEGAADPTSGRFTAESTWCPTSTVGVRLPAQPSNLSHCSGFHWPGARVRFWCKPPSREWHELSPGELLHCSEPGKRLRRWKGFFSLMTDCTEWQM